MLSSPNICLNKSSHNLEIKNVGIEYYKEYLSTNTRLAFLPRESLCTENLKPWIELLPCRNKAGLGLFLQPGIILSGPFHSMGISIKSTREIDNNHLASIELLLTLNFVISKEVGNFLSLASLLGPSVKVQSCPLAQQSTVTIVVEKEMLEKYDIFGESCSEILYMLEVDSRISMLSHPDSLTWISRHSGEDTAPKDCANFSSEDFSSLWLKFDMEGKLNNGSWNEIGIQWQKKPFWKPKTGEYNAVRYLIGKGNERGGLVVEIQSNRKRACDLGTEELDGFFDVLGLEEQGWRSDEADEKISQTLELNRYNQEVDKMNLLQVIPYFLKPIWNTLEVYADGNLVHSSDYVSNIRVFSERNRNSSMILEMNLRFPCEIHLLEISLQFNKVCPSFLPLILLILFWPIGQAFLYLEEYPPDSSRGMDVPPAILLIERSSHKHLVSRNIGFFKPLQTYLILNLTNSCRQTRSKCTFPPCW